MNSVAILEPRPAPLTSEDFHKLESAIEKSFHIKPVYRSVKKPVIDEYGMTKWESDIEEVGLSLNEIGEVDQRVYDAMRRPASPQIIAYHLTRLSAHKRSTVGGKGFQVIVEDVTKDLSGASEWAIIKAFEDLRKAEGAFFPTANEIHKWVAYYHSALGREQKQEPKPSTAPQIEHKTAERTFKQVRRVKTFVRIGLKSKTYWSTWEHKFMKAYPRHTVNA